MKTNKTKDAGKMKERKTYHKQAMAAALGLILIMIITPAAFAELKIDSVYPTLGELGKDSIGILSWMV